MSDKHLQNPASEAPPRSIERLHESEELLRLLVERVSDYAIFVLDLEGRVLSWNPGAQRITGYSADEIIGKHFSRFYPAEAVARGWPQYELQCASEAGRFDDEGWRIRKDGIKFWANVVITALYDHSGVLRGFANITRDLTERKRNEEALRRSEERFRLVVEAVVDYAIFMLDPNGNVLTWNAGAERIKGYRAAEIVGQHFSKFYPTHVRASGWPEYELQQAAAAGRFEDEGWRVRKDGTKFWANVIITALRDEEGQLHGFAKITRDLGERERAGGMENAGVEQQKLFELERAARIEAQRAARVKDEFLATLSHELRTPLNAILGWSQVLRRSRNPEVQDVQRGCEAIERNARVQVQLIDDLLDLSKIIAGRMRLDVQRLMPSDTVLAAIESAEPAAQAKGIRVEKVIDPLAGPVSGDPVRLQQVVWNLLSNAIKFTPKGGKVQIVLERVNSHIELRVSDTGIGIAPDFLPHVFDRFSQQESSASRTHGGLGLGLAIARQLTELHGGTLRAHSDGPGRGASFIVTLPLTVLHTLQPELERSHPTHPIPSDIRAVLPDLTGIRVLLVDDEPDARELAKRVLEGQGALVTTAGSGREALSSLPTVQPHVLLCDLGMPEMDGYQLIRLIRASDTEQRRMPAIAVTALARTEDRKKAMLAGFQTHLAKPFDIAELIIVLAGLVGRTAPK